LCIDCPACSGNLILGGFTFCDDAQEDERRAALEAVADAHPAEKHAQLSLFDGCGCRSWPPAGSSPSATS
jgi:hypothetical protein